MKTMLLTQEFIAELIEFDSPKKEKFNSQKSKKFSLHQKNKETKRNFKKFRSNG